MTGTTNRKISPAREELSRLRTPLTTGEQRVFELFDRGLAPEWEIYVQPHLNGLRPDFVLLNPRVGVGVFDVKDVRLDALEYWVATGADGRCCLRARKPSGEALTPENPIETVMLYRREIEELYCPRLESRADLRGVTAGVLNNVESNTHLWEVLKPIYSEWARYELSERHLRLIGREHIEAGDIDMIFPDHSLHESRRMSPELAADLRHWLEEPEFAAVQRRPLRLDDQKRRLVESRTQTGFRRVRGAAGSGKTTTLAARAVRLAQDGKDVLLVAYNHTLVPWIRDLVGRLGGGAGGVTVLTFHDWCRRVMYQAGAADEYRALWRGHFDHAALEGVEDVKTTLGEALPRLVIQTLSGERSGVDTYDAILVDEGQDFLPAWWEALRRLRRPDGEMLLAADAAQDIYGHAGRWTDEAMVGAGFDGPWNNLAGSYRLPDELIDLAYVFASEYLKPEVELLPVRPDQRALGLGPTRLRWIQIADDHLIDEATCEVDRIVAESGTGGGLDDEIVPFADVVFVCDRIADGAAIARHLEERGIHVIHTFAADSRQSRRLKRYFYKGDARVKGTTVQSFRGWEGRAIVAVLRGDGLDTAGLVYAAITRLRDTTRGSHLSVVSAGETFVTFGSLWPEFVDARARTS